MNALESVAQAAREGRIAPSSQELLERWLTVDRYLPYREALHEMIENERWEALNDAFYQVIPFGTGGRRGPVGIGPNRMNEIAIAESAQGLANKLKSSVEGHNPKVAIAYDTRVTSEAFCRSAACVLAANGIDVLLFEGFRSTPQLSFTIRHLNCDAGIVISASHNPPSDNGFKAYWSDGGQITPPLDAELIEEVRNVEKIEIVPFDEAVEDGRITFLGPEIDEAYIDSVLAGSLSDKRNTRIVYSPLHGVGVTSIVPMLQKAGFEDLHLVELQAEPDGACPNVANHQANPENAEAMTQTVQVAREIRADVAFASDTDADRLAAATPLQNGDWALLTGNQTAAIILEYICAKMKGQQLLKSEHLVLSTAVSSPLIPAIAQRYKIREKHDLLVGFKWLAKEIETLDNPEDFLFGTEESIGYMKGAAVRDKDAACAALMLSEVAGELKSVGRRTLMDLLDDIYRKYGYFRDWGRSVFFEGAKGQEIMETIMDRLRNDPPCSFASEKVVRILDRKNGEVRDPQNEVIGSIEGPRSNLLIFQLEEEGRTFIALRPSGTEPKIKFYYSVFDPLSSHGLDQAKLFAHHRLIAMDRRLSDLAFQEGT